jgi:hypothetical protein
LFYIAANAKDAMDYLEGYKPEEAENKWFEVPRR